MHVSIVSLLKLRHENDELITHLTEAKIQTERLNEELRIKIGEQTRIAEELQKNEQKARRLAEEKAGMAEIGRIISSSLDIDEVYGRFAEEVRKVIPFDRVSINIHDHENKTSHIPYVVGTAVPQRQPGDIFSLSGTATELVARLGTGLIVPLENEKDLSDRFPPLLTTFRAGLRSMIMAPLISKDQVMGSLCLVSKKVNAYSEEELKLAANIAFQISGAIANAQLYAERKRAEEALRKNEQEARRLADEKAVMAEIGRIISSSLNIDEVYDRFAEEVRKIIPFDRVSLAIIDHRNNTCHIPYVVGNVVPERQPGNIFSLSGTVTEAVVKHKSGLILPLEDENSLPDRFPSLFSVFRSGGRSMIMVPLISKDQVM